jgi:hypothetical protein
MSSAGRKRIADATRKRWAEYHRKQAEPAKSARKPAVMKKAAQKKAAKKTVKKTAAREPKATVAEAATQPAVAEGASE